MSFIEAIPEEDIQKLAERLNKYIVPKPVDTKVNDVEKTFTVKDAALITKRHEHTIRSHIKSNLLIAKKSGKNFIITLENLTKYIQNEK